MNSPPKAAAETRERLLRAAAEEISERGYTAASMNSIAARLGMTKGAYAYHYPSKREIAVELAERLQSLLDSARAEADTAYPDRGARALLVLLLCLGRGIVRDPIMAAAVVIALDPATRELDLPDHLLIWSELLIDYIRTAQGLGEISDDVDAEAAGEVLLSANFGIDQFLRRAPERQGAGPLRHLRLLLRGIGMLDVDGVISEVLGTDAARAAAMLPRYAGAPSQQPPGLP